MICSCDADTALCMCGNATFAIVASSVTISAPVMVERVMSARRLGSGYDSLNSSPCSQGPLTGIDSRINAQSRLQRQLRCGLIEGQFDRNPLCHLDPVAGGILRRQQ